MARLQPGDELVVKAGTYTERLTVDGLTGRRDAPIVIRGESRNEVIFDGGCPEFPCPIDKVAWHDEWGLDGLISFRDSDHFALRGVTVRDAVAHGVRIEGGKGIAVEDVLIDGTGSGGLVLEGGPAGVEIAQNEVARTNLGWIDRQGELHQGERDAISLLGAFDFVVAHNRVRDSLGKGIDVAQGSGDGDVHHNTVERTGAAGISVNDARGVRVFRNTVYQAGYCMIDGEPAACSSHPGFGGLFDKAYGDGLLLAVADPASPRAGGLTEIAVYQNVVRGCIGNGLRLGDDLEGGDAGQVSGVRIYNNVLYDCRLSGMRIDAADTQVVNNIIARNGEAGIAGRAVEDSAVTHNLFHETGETAGWPQIEADPQFVDPGEGDFHLFAGSPAIGVGTDVGLPTHSDPDIGAFEYSLEDD